MEIRTGKWLRSPFRMLRYAALLAVTGILMLIFWNIYSRENDRSIAITAPYIAAGQTIQWDQTLIRTWEVARCSWYVGEEERISAEHFCNYTPTEADQEQMIRVRVLLKSGESYEASRYFSVLPVLYLDGDTAYDAVIKEEESTVSMRLEAEGYSVKELYRGGARIHLRGNSTAELSKRHFKLKLEEKAGLLGMGKSRHWVLLANAIDATLLRNQLAYELSRDLGAECYMDSRQVTLIYNGEYCGVYQLCEQIRVAENRVPVYDWEKQAEVFADAIVTRLAEENEEAYPYQAIFSQALQNELETDLSWLDTGVFRSSSLEAWNKENGTDFPTEIRLTDFPEWKALPDRTGGVLLEMDVREERNAMLTAYLQPLHFVSPASGKTCESLYTYVRTGIQSLEYALHETDFIYHKDSPHYRTTDEGWCDYGDQFARVGVQYEEADFQEPLLDGKHYSQIIDMDSLVNNFLLCEFTVNWDAMKNSVYLYKDIEGLWYLSPAWDYDWGWGNSMYTQDTFLTDIWQTTSDYFANESYSQTVQWNRYLVRDPYFLMLAREKYRSIRETELKELIRDGGKLDQYVESIRPAAEANDARWGGSMGTYEGQLFEEGVRELKRFMRERVSWLDKQFETMEELRQSIGSCVTSDQVQLSAETEPDGSVKAAAATGLTEAAAVSLQVNGTWTATEALQEGEASFSVPAEALREGENLLQARLLDAEGNWLQNPEGTEEENYVNAISAYLCYSVE